MGACLWTTGTEEISAQEAAAGRESKQCSGSRAEKVGFLSETSEWVYLSGKKSILERKKTPSPQSFIIPLFTLVQYTDTPRSTEM